MRTALFMTFLIPNPQISVADSCCILSEGSFTDDAISIGKHWSAEQVANTFAPSQETKNAVTEWLAKSGIDLTRITYSTGA